jgi:hypothetical protein
MSKITERKREVSEIMGARAARAISLTSASSGCFRLQAGELNVLIRSLVGWV